MSDVSIASVGAYAPRLYIDAAELSDAWGAFHASGIERKAVPEADEDALTMAVEAAKRALAAAGRDGSKVAHIALGTTTPPMAEEDLTPRLASMLGAPNQVTTQTFTGSTRAGAQALDAALDAGPWGDNVAVVVASDCPRGAPDSDHEHAAGAGAGAFVLDGDGQGTVVDRASNIEPYPGTRFRSPDNTETTGLGITQYNRKAFTTTLGAATNNLETPLDVDAAAVQSPDGKLPYRAADALGVSTDTISVADTVSRLGDTGTASVFLGAAAALEDGASRVLLAAYGSGGGANTFVIDGAIPVSTTLVGDTQLTYPEYLRRRGEITSAEPAGGGAYVSVPSWQRTLPQRHRLIAGRCPNCRTLNFPPDGACYSCHDRPDEFHPVELPGTGTVEAVTHITQGGAPPEFVEQQSKSGPFVSAVIALHGPEETETVSVPTQVLTGNAESVDIGASVETTIRRIYRQEGVIRYGFKAQLLDTRQ